MNQIKERRAATRMNVSCEIYCRELGKDGLQEALCVTLSASGVSFISSQCFDIGSIVEVSIIQEITPTPVLKFSIVIVRCHLIDGGNFEIGATIQIPEEKD